MVDILYGLGLSVSYDQDMTVSTELGNSICAHFKEEQIVFPPFTHTIVFTTAVFDNIDHNPSSTTVHDSFHGTGISLVHMTHENPGVDRGVTILVTCPYGGPKIIEELPSSYINVKPAILQDKHSTVPFNFGPCKPGKEIFVGKLVKENDWLRKTKMLVETGDLNENDFISWPAYHANLYPNINRPSGISALLPLLSDNSHSSAMALHVMCSVKDCIQFVNPDQVPVLSCDQPLYVLAKQVQWS